MSIFDRFSKRSNLSPTIEFGWPIESKELMFKCARFAQAEQNEAHIDAEGQLSRRGVKKDDDSYQQHYLQAYYYELGKYIKRHIKGWTHTPTDGDALKYSAGAFEELFNNMTIGERTEFGMAFWAATIAANEEKKSESES